MILKFQSGGLTAPWVLYTPLSINTASPRTSTGESSKRSSSKGDSESGKLTEKDLLGILKEMKVLPSDSKLILPKLERFIRLQDMGDTVDPAAIAIQFIRSLQEIKNAEYRRAAFEEAYKKVEKEGGLNEFAVNVSGELAVLNKENGEISFVTLDNLDTLNYRPLTNSDVLRLRAEEFGNADALTQLASNGVGMEKISQRINTLFHTLGKDEISNDGYTRSPEAHVMNLLRSKVLEIKSSTNDEQAAQELYDAARLQIGEGISLKGLYKYTEGNSTSNRQLGEALQYIYNGLLPNERTILDLRSGGKKGDGIKAITHMLISTSSTNYKFDLDMLENENGVKPGTKESSSESSNGLNTNFVLNVQQGYGGDYSIYSINAGTNSQLSVEGVNYRSIIDRSGNTIESTSISNMLSKSGLQGITDVTSIYFGNQKVRSDDLSKIVYRNQGGTRVLLPMVKENGKERPNFEILDRYLKEVADKVNAEAKPNTSFEERQKITAKYIKLAKLDELLDERGLPDLNQFGFFFVVDGYASGEDIEIDENSGWIEKVSDDDNSAMDTFEEALNRGKTKDEEKRKVDRKTPIIDDLLSMFDPYEKLYKASIYIPIITNNKLLAVTSTGNHVKYETGKELLNSYNNYDVNSFNKILNMKTNSTEQLWQQ